MDDRSIQELLDLFGLAPDFNINQLSRAYRDLVQVWHPDRFQNNARLKQMAEEKTKEINAAYSILKRWHHRKGERRKEESESPKEKHYRDEEFSNEETAQETEFKSNSYSEADSPAAEKEKSSNKGWFSPWVLFIAILATIATQTDIFKKRAINGAGRSIAPSVSETVKEQSSLEIPMDYVEQRYGAVEGVCIESVINDSRLAYCIGRPSNENTLHPRFVLYSMMKDDRDWHVVSVDTILKAQYSYATLEQGPELVIVDGDKYIFIQFRTSQMGTAMGDWETYHFQLLELPYGRTFELRFTVNELIYQRLIKNETIYNRWGDVRSITIDDVVDAGNFYIGSRRIKQGDFYRNIQTWLKKRAQLHENRVLFDLN